MSLGKIHWDNFGTLNLMVVEFTLSLLIRGSKIVFISMLGLLRKLSEPNMYTDSINCLIFQYSLLTSFHNSLSSFVFYISSAISNLQTTAFQCSFTIIFSEWLVSSFYSLLQLHRMS